MMFWITAASMIVLDLVARNGFGVSYDAVQTAMLICCVALLKEIQHRKAA